MHDQPSHSHPDDLHRIDLEAAEWLIKHDRGFTPTEQDHYFQWLAADPRHGEWFARHRETWRELNTLAQWRPEHSLEPNPDLLAPAKSRRRRARVVWFWSGALTAAAAGLAVVLALWQSPRAVEGLAPVPAKIAAQSYERRVLEDGSVIELNRGALVAVDYTAEVRRVRLLQGEALFTVEKNPGRPFIVHAAGVDVRAIGTAFNVRLAADNVEVLVTHGRVQVETPATVAENLTGQVMATAIPVLEAGESVTVPLTVTAPLPQVSRMTEDEMTRRLAWQPRLLEFKSTPLAEVVAEFNRHGGPRIVIADAGLETIPIVMSFRSDNAEGFVRLLELTAGVKAERAGDTLVLRRAP
jgi:transmembrane sensor